MIRIEKDVAIPDLPVYTKASIGPKDKRITRAANELARAIDFFTDHKNYANNHKLTKKAFSFRVYKDDKLAAELAKIFGSKCGYCESQFGAVTPRDIEHFRPKSEVENEGQPVVAPAYFWLAAEWSNLLVSCPDCNRARKHMVPGQPKEVRLGKQSQFPLADETKRVRLHSVDIDAEEPHRLLLHPCFDQPEDHLTYDVEGLVLPKMANDEKAKTSIFVYALQRKGLVEERKRILNDLQMKLEMLKSLAVELNAMDGTTLAATRQSKLDQIALQMRGICILFQDCASYLGMLRDYLRRNLAAGAFTDIVNAGIDLDRLLP